MSTPHEFTEADLKAAASIIASRRRRKVLEKMLPEDRSQLAVDLAQKRWSTRLSPKIPGPISPGLHAPCVPLLESPEAHPR